MRAQFRLRMTFAFQKSGEEVLRHVLFGVLDSRLMSRNSVTSISTDWGDDPTAGGGGRGGDGGGEGDSKDGQYYVYNSGDDELYEIPSQNPPGAKIIRYVSSAQ